MPRLYFDYNATTPLPPPVCEVLIHALREDLKNPSSVHQDGQKARKIWEGVRCRIALNLDCKDSEIIFTSGATESNNTVLNSVWERRDSSRNRIVVTAVEHESVLKPTDRLAEKGAEVHVLTVNREGELDPHKLE